MTALCQFCRRPVGLERAGRFELHVVVIPYQDKLYCLPCWDKLRHVAVRTGGAL